MDIKDKVAVVTGASGGIGRATAGLLMESGAEVALVSRSREKLNRISRKLPGSIPIVCDMSKPARIKQMVNMVKKHYGGIDILINNAGRGYDAPLEKTDTGTLRDIFDLDIIGPLVAMQCVIPIMRSRGGGAIVNIGSGTSLMILPDMGAYSGLKLALAQITKTAAEELKKDNITVSVVYPYITDTDFEKNTVKESIDLEEEAGDAPPFPPDSPGHVAGIILEAVRTGAVEIFAHEWMKKL
jgi:short-subunit dehydrogenase